MMCEKEHFCDLNIFKIFKVKIYILNSPINLKINYTHLRNHIGHIFVICH